MTNAHATKVNAEVRLGVNGKPICDFLLVNNCNLAVSAIVFEIFRLKDRKLLILPTPSLFYAPLGVIPFEFCDEIWHEKTRIMGLPDSEEIMTLAFTIPDRDGRTDMLRSLLLRLLL